MEWFGVRCLFGAAGAYEERVTVWSADDADAAIALAEDEAAGYAAGNDLEFLGLSQLFHLVEPPGHGTEVFSLVRESPLPADAYLDQFFDTGAERQSAE